MEENEKIEVIVPLDQFEHEVRDFQQHSVTDFLTSSHFKKEFVIEDRKIKTLAKM